MKSISSRTGLIVLILLPAFRFIDAQTAPRDSTQSIIMRSYTPPLGAQLIRPSQTEYRLWQGFMLVRSANDGDPAAEHELGLRYFLGDGFPQDTALAAYWIGKAAEQKMPIAEYNYGVFLNNGWGVKWNPFKAFEEFKEAADNHLPEAELALGLMYTDNLVVQRDWAEAYKLVKASAETKYSPAVKILSEFVRRGIGPGTDSNSNAKAEEKSISSEGAGSFQPVFLNFGADTVTQVNDSTILEEAYRNGGAILQSALPKRESNTFRTTRDPNSIRLLKKAANLGDPEALTVLGRCYEKGSGVRVDPILAAEQYLRAARLDSRQALVLLLDLARNKTFNQKLESRTKAGSSDAAYVWAGLTELGFDQRLDSSQAIELLKAAAAHGNIPALLELGRCYYTGQLTATDTALGRQCWLQAAEEGSVEAKVRLAAAAVLGDSPTAERAGEASTSHALADTIKILTSASHDGSVIAQLALAYCFEYGIGLAKDTPEAVKIYRITADHGSRAAYEGLRVMYNRIRPSEVQFQIKTVNN